MQWCERWGWREEGYSLNATVSGGKGGRLRERNVRVRKLRA